MFWLANLELVVVDVFTVPGFEVNFMDDVGQTLLNWASAFGTQEMVCVRACVRMHMCVCTCMCVCLCIYICVCVCMHEHLYVCVVGDTNF